MSSNKNTKNRPEYATGPIVCKPWCEDHDGHWLKPGDGRVPFAGDQYCGTAQSVISLSPVISEEGVRIPEVGLSISDHLAVETIGIDLGETAAAYLTRAEWEQHKAAGDALWTLADLS